MTTAIINIDLTVTSSETNRTTTLICFREMISDTITAILTRIIRLAWNVDGFAALSSVACFTITNIGSRHIDTLTFLIASQIIAKLKTFVDVFGASVSTETILTFTSESSSIGVRDA
ncbi:hypothetical protein QR98_0076720 [Sarcoptes scabiei]|uniref:Uncharacterized protein n=1 Tax=Sarcoptes scabiei TaxID=52283 RepID=A0A132AE61_SARSC|nr:hypothetical protein QR98_0076720 [Sarcoptes scabiei]